MTTHINRILRTGADLTAAENAADGREVGRLLRHRQQQIIDALNDGVPTETITFAMAAHGQREPANDHEETGRTFVAWVNHTYPA